MSLLQLGKHGTNILLSEGSRRTQFYLLFAHDAQLSQALQVLSLGGLLGKFLWGCPSRRSQCSLLLRRC